METIDATELLLAGLERATEEGAVFAYHREDGADYVDIRATTRFDDGTRTIFIRCYVPGRILGRSD